jgi:hypothetical protein
MSLYRKLAELRNQFVCIDTVSGRSVLRNSGLLITVMPEYITLVLYDDHGERDYEFSVVMSAVLAVYTGHREEQELSLKVSLAATGKEIPS